jgi:Na+/H+ antiporter NhaD/arsenite permease-like protein
MSHDEHHASSRQIVPAVIVAIIVVYAGLLVAGAPQWATQQIVAEQTEHGGAAAESAVTDDDAAAHGAEAHGAKAAPPFWAVTPFALLLCGIAVLPLIPRVAHWWESNLHRFYVAAGLSVVALAYYAFLYQAPLEGHWPAHHVVHPADSSIQTSFVTTVLANAILEEYVPFIVLLFSLYTISGGIRITGDLQAKPKTNAAFMAIGGVLASFVGTTGAAMLLIRPVLETNSERKHVAHTIVFFIFIVCNCGGCLLPLGDPPLFLGYLQGVPFTWTLVLWREWLFVNGALLVIYLLMDSLWFYRRETLPDIKRDVDRQHGLRFSGWELNSLLLLGVVLAVAFLDPGKRMPGTSWYPWLYLREVVQLGLVAASLYFGSQRVRYANRFNYHAIIEVAVVFIGIFITMQPALQILKVHGAELGISTPTQFFWATGFLSGILDNAPTYLVFFQAAEAMPQPPDARLVAGVEHVTLVGISLGAVFMGAMTYIGNGPNFMVRAIAEKSDVKMPSFFGFVVYSGLILLPVLGAMVWLEQLFPY